MKNFLGKDGFNWWVGVVESRIDPLNVGRVRVRIFGWHTDNLNELPSEDLPWAHPILPSNSRDFSNTPYENDWIVGFFMDGEAGQFPVYMGVLPGIPSKEYDTSKGFSDQRTSEQLSQAPQNDYPRGLNEPTTSRLYRNESIDKTIVQKIKDNKVTGIPTSSGGSWNQPDPSYNTLPPYNEVVETESGHVFELDDTKNSERVNLAHRTGTFLEMRPDGSQVTRIVKDNYEIVSGDDYVVVQGNCNLTINGNSNIYVKGNVVEKIDGDYDLNVTGDIRMNGKTVNINQGTMGAARIGDTADTGDDGTGGHYDTNKPGTNVIESGSGTVFIGD